mgnify:CR=1 FL=1|jgi:hypothetical protein|tara:strand:- start:8799 stop:10073 length:1275 start_codon:yes stop_codon:yes gene_type:complete
MAVQPTPKSIRVLDTEIVDGQLANLDPYKRRNAERAIQEAYIRHERTALIFDKASGLVRNITRYGFTVNFMLNQSTFKVMTVSENPDDPSDEDSDGYFIYMRNGKEMAFPLSSSAMGGSICHVDYNTDNDGFGVNRVLSRRVFFLMEKAIIGVDLFGRTAPMLSMDIARLFSLDAVGSQKGKLGLLYRVQDKCYRANSVELLDRCRKITPFAKVMRHCGLTARDAGMHDDRQLTEFIRDLARVNEAMLPASLDAGAVKDGAWVTTGSTTQIGKGPRSFINLVDHAGPLGGLHRGHAVARPTRLLSEDLTRQPRSSAARASAISCGVPIVVKDQSVAGENALFEQSIYTAPGMRRIGMISNKNESSITLSIRLNFEMKGETWKRLNSSGLTTRRYDLKNLESAECPVYADTSSGHVDSFLEDRLQ